MARTNPMHDIEESCQLDTNAAVEGDTFNHQHGVWGGPVYEVLLLMISDSSELLLCSRGNSWSRAGFITAFDGFCDCT